MIEWVLANLSFVLRVILGISFIWIAAALTAALLRYSSASLRHRIWALSTIAVLLLPALVLLLPAWLRVALPLPAEVPAMAPAAPPVRSQGAPAGPSDTLQPPANPLHAVLQNEPISPAPTKRSIPWTPILWIAWLLPALGLVSRQLLGLLTAHRFLRRATSLDSSAASTCLAQLLPRLGLTLRPALRQSSEIDVPLCLGLHRPAILLPATWPTWPAAQLQAVLTHELAHIARRDVLWQLLARLAAALYWPHPLAWLAAWRMRIERELACDDWVLRGGESSTHYARCLLDLATALTGPARAAEAVGVAMAARSGFEKRISAILDPTRRRLPLSRRAAATLTLATLALVTLFASLTPLAPTPAAAVPAKHPTVRISGRVENEQGQPVADATVECLAGTKQYRAQTGQDGRFTCTILERELNYADLLATANDGCLTYQDLNSVQAAAKSGDLRLTLRPAREFAITVNDDKGLPVPDAWIAATAWYSKVGQARTDAAGKARLRVPANAPLMYILAHKPDVGLDYVIFRRKDETLTDPYRLAPDHSAPLTFVLNGVTTVQIRVTDDQQRPLQGVNVRAWLFEKPRKGDDLNLSGLHGFDQMTDERGIARIQIPADNTSRITFWPTLAGYCAPNRCIWDPQSGTTEAQVQMLRLIPVTGSVLDAQGQPVAGATVRIDGQSYAMDSFYPTSIQANDAGRFEIEVNPDNYYMFVAAKDRLVSPAHFQIIRNIPPATPIQLTLEPGTRVYGRVTGGPDRTPVPGASVTLVQYDHGSYYKRPQDQQFPGGTTGRRSITPGISQHLKADQQGAFEFYITPGEFEYALDVYTDGTRLSQRFKLPARGEYTLLHDGDGMSRRDRTEESLKYAEEQGLEINLHIEQLKPKPNLLKGRVVLRDQPDVGVPDVILSGTHVQYSDVYPRGASDKQGNFTLARGKFDLYLYATTPDQKLRGILVAKPTDDNVTIPIGPTASARGRLLDETGKPLVERLMDFGVRIDLASGGITYCSEGKARTDKDGLFIIEGLVPGFEYSLNVVMEVGDDGEPRSWRTVGKAKADRPDHLELGDVQLRSPTPPRR